MTRIDKRYRGKPLPVSDLQELAKFRAELAVYTKLREQGLGHEEAMRRVGADEQGGSSDQ